MTFGDEDSIFVRILSYFEMSYKLQRFGHAWAWGPVWPENQRIRKGGRHVEAGFGPPATRHLVHWSCGHHGMGDKAVTT